jgi:hypothetical protein
MTDLGYRLLAMSVDALHLAAMLVWGVGLPLLVWHRWPTLSRLYMWYSVTFVAVTVLSHQLFDECVLTTVARWLWHAAGVARDITPFTTIAVNTIASVSPSSRTIVLLWELGVLVSSLGSLWCWSRTRARRGGEQQDIALH